MADTRHQVQSGNGNGLTAILGAGSLGRLWAALLPTGTTTFILRQHAPEEHKPDVTYRFQGCHGSQFPVTVPSMDWTTRHPDVLIATTKAGDTLSALEATLPNLKPTVPVVLFQNGMGSQQAVAERWPNRPIMAASTTEGANRPDNSTTVHAGRGETWIGALTPSASPLVTGVANQLKASGLVIHEEPNILRRLWGKLIINAGINPYTAILDCANGDILDAPLFRETIGQLCLELAEVMHLEGLPPRSPEDMQSQIEAVARSTAKNTSSMCSDVRRGKPTEIDYINGFIVSRARAHNLPAPVNQMLTERVKLRTTKLHEPLSDSPGAT
ncbi:2-dehydropantoate 2-reductase [Marinobacter lipolyticus SM19]|uniref:2-dehydropantoate 2-reductase n=1 Tax=Marinobacter lipolyticus SM19 TaxID=1318628 RepID=R8AXB0_9GAMM|nr:ketopantoate reductase family protein [Marinobacter lipolyticus]EON90965.1 2-dehydropantoate 2-reductase [Marinobacter lipolyticus SM19]